MNPNLLTSFSLHSHLKILPKTSQATFYRTFYSNFYRVKSPVSGGLKFPKITQIIKLSITISPVQRTGLTITVFYERKQYVMPEINIFNEMLKLLGVGGAFLFILYVYHKSVTKQFDTILANQNEREKETFSQMNKIIDNQAKREESNFKLLQDMVSTNILQNAHLEKIEGMIENSRWCPYARKFLGGSIEPDNFTN